MIAEYCIGPCLSGTRVRASFVSCKLRLIVSPGSRTDRPGGGGRRLHCGQPIQQVFATCHYQTLYNVVFVEGTVSFLEISR